MGDASTSGDRGVRVGGSAADVRIERVIREMSKKQARAVLAHWERASEAADRQMERLLSQEDGNAADRHAAIDQLWSDTLLYHSGG